MSQVEKPLIADPGRRCTKRLAECHAEVTVMTVAQAGSQLCQINAAIGDHLQSSSQADLIEVLMDGDPGLPAEDMT